MAEHLCQVDVGYFCCGIVVRDNKVVDAAPIMRWAIGKEFSYVNTWVNRKRGRIIRVEETR